MGWILNILSIPIFVVIAIVDFFTRLFTKRSENFAYTMAYKKNVLTNELYGETFNILFCKKGCKCFGLFGEPFSSAFGKGHRDQGLNKAGRIIRKIIDIADVPMALKKKSHTTHWIKTDEEINNYRKTLK